MKSVKQMIIDEISFFKACTEYYNDLTEEDVDYIVKKSPQNAACYLKKIPLLTQKHVDYIVKKEPTYAARYLNQHLFLTQKHVDYILENAPWYAITYIPHRLSEENIAYISQNYPNLLKEIFK